MNERHTDNVFHAFDASPEEVGDDRYLHSKKYGRSQVVAFGEISIV